MKKVISRRNNLDAVFYFKPVQRFEYMGDMFGFRVSSYCTSRRVLQ